MDRKEIDDLKYSLGELLKLYGKVLETTAEKFWIAALSDKPLPLILKAFREYSKTGKYAPKPVDILELIALLKVTHRRDEAPPVRKPCNPEIVEAWITYMRFAYDFNFRDSVKGMSLDRALEIVNREAVKHNQPDAILLEHRIPEFWGAA
jgi:hypothetical protein